MKQTDENHESYSLDDVAEEHSANNFVADTEHTTLTLASSLFTCSEMLGHNNKNLVKAVATAQQIIGDTSDLTDKLRPFEVSDTAVNEANAYLQMLKNTSKVCTAQAKMMKSDNQTVFRDIERLVNDVGTAEDYNKMVF